ncbi:hypothetical protein QZJ86_04710 [Methylomonas montana]|uniref:hypothetical protein n=1 Tax=Methylomonas montana TaxID=3058963 RepID=UPI00265B6051|nr:hypothetical protein [Methylomonas montana]WKJ91438.1 hypothetical protein QZJ86_04710 [Methylomonas montana]
MNISNLMLVLTLFLLTGCGSIITVPIDPNPISTDKSTLIIYHEQGFTDEFPVFLDKKPLGHVTSETPLKVEVEPGSHEIYTQVPMNVIDEINNFVAENGKTHFFKIRLELGMWVSNIWTELSPEITSYQVRSHKQ